MQKKYLLASIAMVVGLATLGLVMLVRPADGMCGGASPKSYQIVISHGKADPDTVRGHLCDKLTFVNRDNETREVAFGPHEDHVPYDGVAERFLNKNQSFTITLNATGTYHWHDHLHDEVEGYFMVSK